MEMKKIILLFALGMLITLQADAASEPQPCSGKKGGISHCTSYGALVCKDGSIKLSEQFCSKHASGRSQQVKPSAAVRKEQPKKDTLVGNQQQQHVDAYDDVLILKRRQPTCSPLYMANKRGFTHLPICTGNQY